MKRFLRVEEGKERYGPTAAWWRKHVSLGTLGKAVVRAGRIVLLDSELLDERLARTGQLLTDKKNAGAKADTVASMRASGEPQ
jgi:hypothetical protein